MKLLVNGEAHEVDGPMTVAGLVDRMALERRGLAVAVNGEVVPRSTWGGQALVEGDQIEMLTIAQGG